MLLWVTPKVFSLLSTVVVTSVILTSGHTTKYVRGSSAQLLMVLGFPFRTAVVPPLRVGKAAALDVMCARVRLLRTQEAMVTA